MIPSPVNASTRPDLAGNGPLQEALDLVIIEGLQGQTVIGICDTELHRPQALVIDLQLGLLRARACSTDRIGDTVDYGVVRQRVHRLLREHRLQLLEAFAEALAEVLIQEFGARWVRVKVVKPHKFDDLLAVGVQIERWAAAALPARTLQPDSGERRAAAVLRLIGTGMVPGGA